MLARIRNLPLFLSLLGAIAAALVGVGILRAADHGDTPLLVSIGRHDVRLTGVHAFVRSDNLVIVLGIDPTIPPEVTEYIFPTDVKFHIAIDNDSEVAFNDPDDLAEFGGTIVRPKRIKEDIVFEITFNDDNEPRLRLKDEDDDDDDELLNRDDDDDDELLDRIRLFTGLRDDPFIRGPRIGRNVAAIVLEMPLNEVLNEQPTLLIWATAKAEVVKGRFHELAGRALRSQFPENDLMNTLHPRKHLRELGIPPDVIIFDTSLPASFPNGRELTDDVVDLVGDPRPLRNDDPFPSANDVSFLQEFPYLAPPQ